MPFYFISSGDKNIVMPFGVSDFGFGLSFTLQDQFSATANKIKQNFGQLDQGVKTASNTITENMKNIGGALVGGGILLGMKQAVMASAEMSDMLADVTKTTGITGDALQELRGQLESIDTRTATSQLLEMAKAGGSMGIAAKDIGSFTESMDKINVALGDQFSSADELAMSLTKMRNVLKDIKTDRVDQDLLHIGNVLNFMGANAAATEGDIANIVGRMAGMGQQLGMTSAQIFGISTALSESGVNAEVAGSNFPIILSKMAASSDDFAKKIGADAAEFRNLVNTDIVGAVKLFAGQMKQQYPTATSMSEALGDLGLSGARVGEVFSKFAGNLELVDKRIGEAGEALTNTDSIMGEFNAKNTTLAAVLEKAEKRIGAVVVRIGDALAPAVEILAKGIEKAAMFISYLASTTIGKWLIIAVAGFTALVAIMSIVSFVIPIVTAGFTLLTGAVWAALWPIMLIVGAIAAVIYVGYKMVQLFTEGGNKAIAFGMAIAYLMGPIGWVIGGFLLIKRAFSEFNSLADGGEAKTGILGFLQKVGGVLTAVMEIWRSFTLEGFDLSVRTKEALEKMGILKFVLAIGGWMVKTKRFFNDVKEGVKEAFGEIGQGFTMWFDYMKNMFTEIATFFGSIFNPIVEWFTGLWDRMINKVMEFVNSIKSFFGPLTSFVGSIIDWIGSKFDWLSDKIIGMFDWVIGIIDSVKGFLDISDQVSEVKDVSQSENKITTASDSVNKLAAQSAEMAKVNTIAQQKNGNSTVSVNVPEQKEKTIKNIIMLDGREIASSVNQINNFDDKLE